MTNKDVTTILKAGYVIITPAGQTPQNLGKLQELAIQYFGDVMNQSHIEIARDKMSNGEMIENLPKLSPEAKSRATPFLFDLYLGMKHPKSESYGQEIYVLMASNNDFNSFSYPDLFELLEAENAVGKVLGKGGFFSK